MAFRDGKVTLNHKGMEKMLKSREVRDALRPKAEQVLAAAIADPHDDTGDYEASLHIEDATTDRAVLRIVADDWKAPILEAAYGILARALDGASGLVKYTSKSGKTSMITQAQADNYSRNKK